MTTSGMTDVYADFAGLAQLRVDASRDSASALPDVAKQFEALFLQMMLKSMRAATPGDPLLSGEGSRMYRDLFDQQVSLELAKGKGIGIADLLMRQLDPLSTSLEVPAITSSSRGPARSAVSPEVASLEEHIQSPMPASAGEVFESREEFVHALWPHARRAAIALGVTPQVLIAQAALETGWGRSIIRQPDGSSSHNVFGIKADSGWDGSRARVATLEHSQGIMVRQKASFRTYASFKESFDDYVNFISTQKRYRPALEVATNPEAYMQGLQDAGYATDPKYANKVMNLMRSDVLRSLKLLSDDPLQNRIANQRSQ